MSCAHCGRKGHTASECRQPKVELANRRCCNCVKTGHRADQSKELKKQPIKVLEDSKAARPVVL